FFAGTAVAAVLLARLILLDKIDHPLRIAKRVSRRAVDRIGDRVARLLAGFAGVDCNGRHAAARWRRWVVIRSGGGRIASSRVGSCWGIHRSRPNGFSTSGTWGEANGCHESSQSA